MRAPALVSRRGLTVCFRRDSFLSQLISVLLAWAMIMSSLPVSATDQPRAKWVHSWDFGSGPKSTAPLPHKDPPTMMARTLPSGRVASPHVSGNPVVAMLHAPALPGNGDSDLFFNAFGANLFAPLFQAQNSPLQISVGFADNSSASANFPEPWNEANPLINFVGGGTVYRAGAIRIDNPGN
jgi:hypothetical protein